MMEQCILELEVFHQEATHTCGARLYSCGAGGLSKEEAWMIAILILHRKRKQILKIILENPEIQNLCKQHLNPQPLNVY